MKAIPLTLITGFLGAGKSTLINQIIQAFPQKKFGLIVNEFGDVKLESHILETTKEEITELSNGCMCCVVRSDLVNAVEQMLQKNVDYIIVEASGLSDPIPLTQTFVGHTLQGKIRLDAILCVADALNFEQNLDKFVITSSQLKSADIVLISKSQEVSSEKLKDITAFIKGFVPDALVFDLAKNPPLKKIIDVNAFDYSSIEELEEEHDDHEHSHDENHEHHHENHDSHDHKEHAHHHEHFDTVFIKTKKPLDYKKFSEQIFSLKADIIRAKGFIDFGKSTPQEGKYILQFVGSRKHMVLKQWKENEERMSAMVFIGKELNEKKLKACIKASEL